MNYYMWQGGTTWGRFTGGPLLVTSYDYDVALDEYGLPHNPKYSHSTALHLTLQAYARAIVENPVDPGKQLSTNTFVNVYGTPGRGGPLDCVAFLSNIDSSHDYTVTWNGHSYNLPAWSVSIVGGCGAKVTFNTAQLTSETTKPVWNSITDGSAKRATTQAAWSWSWWQDTVGIWDPSTAIKSPTPLEQVKTTNDTTDYFWYSASLTSSSSGTQQFSAPIHDFGLVFVNGEFQGSATNAGEAHVNVRVPSGRFTLNVLTQSVGLMNYGAHYEANIVDGIVGGSIHLGGVEITRPSGGWTHQIGLKGESLQVWTSAGGNKVTWNSNTGAGLGKQLTWWRTSFSTPSGSSPLALDMTGVGKGFAYINGHGLGRYWNIIASGNCPLCSDIDKHCDYRGAYGPGQCQCDCGIPSQRYYHVPRDWLAPGTGTNNLVILDELGASDLSKVKLVTRS